MKTEKDKNAPEKKPVADKKQEAKATPSIRIRGWRLWVFRVICGVFLPALIFVSLEVALRISGYGYPAKAITECKIKGEKAYCSNGRFGWRFFPPKITRAFHPFAIPSNKPDDTYRIFVLGASAAQGVPDSSYSFGRFLEVMLRQQYPKTNFEVYTAAMPAINSHVVVEIAKNCADHDPDLFVVYLGNNEVVGPYGAGTVFSQLSSNLALIRTSIAIKGTKIGQLMTGLAKSRRASEQDAFETWKGLEMFLDKQIRLSAPQMQDVYSHFQRNLETIAEIASNQNCDTIFCTVGVNLRDNPPFASLHRTDLNDIEKDKWDAIYAKAMEYEQAGDFSAAVEQYMVANEIDNSYAELHFRSGHCYGELAEFGKAKQSYLLALENDTLRFRADGKINDIIREVAADKTLGDKKYFVDVARAIEQNSPHGCPGFELFLEHVHFNFTGNYFVGKTVLEKVEQILPEQIKQHKAKDLALLTEQQCAKQLGYTDRDRYAIAKKNLDTLSLDAPFTNQIYMDSRVSVWNQMVQQLEPLQTREGFQKAMDEYRQIVEAGNADWPLRAKYTRALLEEARNLGGTVKQLHLLIEDYPEDYLSLLRLAHIEITLGNYDGVLEHCSKALRYAPWDVDAHYILGVAYKSQSKFEQANKCFENVLRLDPNYGHAYTNLGQILFAQKKIDKAAQMYRRGLEVAPEIAILHYNLGLCLLTKKQIQQARQEFEAALTVDPNFTGAKQMLERLSKQGRF